MRIGVYVGSFNPIHKGHKHVVEFLLSNNYVDKMIVVPTIEYWDKQKLLDLEKREEMINLSFEGKVIVKSFPSLQYTYQIMKQIQLEFPNDELYLVIGADNLNDLDKWKNVNELSNYYIIVINRGNEFASVDKFKFKDRFVLLKDFPFLDISSTQIRKLIRCKEYDKVKEFVDNNVVQYIRDNNLYLEEE